ncbi:myelin-associated glycoprotein isoform X1 [Labrus bergylta]|uniref:myelin-associated glycoprotein isoform X1 n=1 Tax=Labrus bergylta TaxID=56723 RepID=UPI003313299D
MGTTYLLGLLSLITGFSVLQQVRSWNITVPKTVTAVEGSCAVVPCQTKAHVRVTWYQYSKMYYPVVYDRYPPTVEQQFRGRTSVKGAATEGNCTLTIKNIRRTDNNLKVYVWINPDSITSQKFYDQTVTVYVERKAPIISIEKQIVEGDVFQANCSLIHSCPSSTPSLKWIQNQFLNNSTLKASNEKENMLWLYTETVYGLATYEMHNSKMGCSAVFSDLTIDGQPVILNILYKPVNVTLTAENDSVIDGGSVIMKCAANSNPRPHTYSWFTRQMGQNIKSNTKRGRLLFNNITRKTSISCMALNDIGAGQSDWLDLDVQHAPIILPASSCYLTGEALKCVCQAEAFPDASIHWTINGNDTFSSSFSFVFTNEKHVTSGQLSGPAESQVNVTCTATNSLGSDTRRLDLHLSESSSLSMWLVAVMLLVGIALLCAVGIYIKYSQLRSSPGSLSNASFLLRPLSLPETIQEEQRYQCPQRVQVEETQSNTGRPESDPEEDTLSCVYDNCVVEEIRQSRAKKQENNATAPSGEVTEEPLGKDGTWLHGGLSTVNC